MSTRVREGGLDAPNATFAAAVPFQIYTTSSAHLGKGITLIHCLAQHVSKAL